MSKPVGTNTWFWSLAALLVHQFLSSYTSRKIVTKLFLQSFDISLMAPQKFLNLLVCFICLKSCGQVCILYGKCLYCIQLYRRFWRKKNIKKCRKQQGNERKQWKENFRNYCVSEFIDYIGNHLYLEISESARPITLEPSPVSVSVIITLTKVTTIKIRMQYQSIQRETQFD